MTKKQFKNTCEIKTLQTLGITGYIGMGKTTVAGQFASLGIPVFDADKTAHEILTSNNSVINEVGKMFPTVVDGGVINREKLGKIVFNSVSDLKKLENLLHPVIHEKMEEFIQVNSDEKIILLDIPLLFQTGWDKECDYTIRVTAPYFIQKMRLMKRPHMTKEKFKHILEYQRTEHTTDFTIQTGWGRGYSMMQVRKIIKSICP